MKIKFNRFWTIKKSFMISKPRYLQLTEKKHRELTMTHIDNVTHQIFKCSHIKIIEIFIPQFIIIHFKWTFFEKIHQSSSSSIIIKNCQINQTIIKLFTMYLTSANITSLILFWKKRGKKRKENRHYKRYLIYSG